MNSQTKKARTGRALTKKTVTNGYSIAQIVNELGLKSSALVSQRLSLLDLTRV